MSVQSGTIAPRKTVELPLWGVGAIALIVLGLVATVVVQRQTGGATAEKAAVVRPALPASVGTTAHVRPATQPLVKGSIYTSSTANIREGGAVFPATFPGALETSGFARTTAFTPVMDSMANIREGGAVFPAGIAPPQPIMVGDYACHQCG